MIKLHDPPPIRVRKIATPPFQTHLYASGIKSADFRIQIAEKTHDPPIDCLKSE